MDDKNLDLLTQEARNEEIKKRSHKRLFIAFLSLTIFLSAYLIYSLIMLFVNL